MTVNELIRKLQDMVKGDPTIGQLNVHTEGCDCVAAAGDIAIDRLLGGEQVLTVQRADISAPPARFD